MHHPLHPNIAVCEMNDNRVRCAALNPDASQKARRHLGPN